MLGVGGVDELPKFVALTLSFCWSCEFCGGGGRFLGSCSGGGGGGAYLVKSTKVVLDIPYKCLRMDVVVSYKVVEVVCCIEEVVYYIDIVVYHKGSLGQLG